MLDSSNKTQKPNTGLGPSCWCWLWGIFCFSSQELTEQSRKENLGATPGSSVTWNCYQAELVLLHHHHLCTYLMSPPKGGLFGDKSESHSLCVCRTEHSAWKAALLNAASITRMNEQKTNKGNYLQQPPHTTWRPCIWHSWFWNMFHVHFSASWSHFQILVLVAHIGTFPEIRLLSHLDD